MLEQAPLCPGFNRTVQVIEVTSNIEVLPFDFGAGPLGLNGREEYRKPGAASSAVCFDKEMRD